MKTILVINDDSFEAEHAAKFALVIAQKVQADILLANRQSETRKIIEKAGLWDETLSLLDDTEYFMKTILAADKIIFSSNSLLYYRSGLNNSLSRTKTRKGFESAFTAIEKASQTLLSKRNDHAAKLACANNWQLFIYDHYPNYPELTNKAEAYIQQLTTPDLPFPSGGYTKFLLNFLNWKTIKSIKQKIS